MAKTRSVLGKGLSALIPGAGQDEEFERNTHARSESSGIASGSSSRESVLHAHPTTAASISKIEIAKVAPNPLQPRKDFPKESLAELTQSIREHGIIQAITVRKVAGDRYELVSGERRVRASIEAGLTDIPAYILDVNSDRSMLELAIIENVQRQQFNPIEEAQAYQRLIEECQLTQEEVAEKIARDRSTVTNFLRLLKLPEPIQHSLRNGELGLGHAKAVMGLSDDPEQQIALWKRAVSEHYSVRKLEDAIRSRAARHPTDLRSSKGAKSTLKAKASEQEEYERPAELVSMENSFKHLLGTQVKVRLKADSTGEVAIQFYSHDDLDRIRELLTTIQPT